MKIGFDAKRYYHNQTGLGNYSRTIVGGLQKQFPDNEYILYDEKSFDRTFRLGHKAAKDGCDIFHGLSNEIPSLSPTLSRREGASTHNTAFIVTIHDVAWRTFPDMYHWADRKIYDWKYGSSCRRADKIIAISESTKKDVMRFYGVPEEKISVIYQPVQEYYYNPLPKSEARRLIREQPLSPTLSPNRGKGVVTLGDILPATDDDGFEFILYVGSINSRKNLMCVLQAMAMMPKDNRPFLLIIGNGREYLKECEAFIKKNDLQNYTRIETNIHNSNVLQALYSEATAFVYPSFYEGFGLPVVEAALQKTPVITTTASSLPEAAGPDACLLDPHSSTAAEQMKDYIDILCSEPSFATKIGTKMEAYARRMFTPEKLIGQVMECYKKTL